jgi:gliding motility-associated lipoprotein GldD
MNMKAKRGGVVILLAFVIFALSCERNYTPKPMGYFRIDLPQKEYRLFDTTYPYLFEYPVYAEIIPDTRPNSEPYWINIEYPRFKGTIYISYKSVSGNLVEYLEDSRTFVIKHIPKAEAIEDSLIYSPENEVFGLIYDIQGTGAASPCQFFVTDSSNHFLRGALYFNTPPNNDSLAPVIEFIREDIDHLLKTFHWK